MALADDIGAEGAILAQAAQEPEIPMIDCVRGTKRPVIRHLVKQELERGWILTECGHKVICYFNANRVSLYYTDGSVYARYCKKCFPTTSAGRNP